MPGIMDRNQNGYVFWQAQRKKVRLIVNVKRLRDILEMREDRRAAESLCEHLLHADGGMSLAICIVFGTDGHRYPFSSAVEFLSVTSCLF